MNGESGATSLEKLFGLGTNRLLRSLAAVTDFLIRLAELILLNVAFEVGARLTGNGLINTLSTVLRVALGAFLMLAILKFVNSLDIDRNLAATLILLLGIPAIAFVFVVAIVFSGLVATQVPPLSSAG